MTKSLVSLASDSAYCPPWEVSAALIYFYQHPLHVSSCLSPPHLHPLFILSYLHPLLIYASLSFTSSPHLHVPSLFTPPSHLCSLLIYAPSLFTSPPHKTYSAPYIW